MLRNICVNKCVSQVAAVRHLGPAYTQRTESTVPATSERLDPATFAQKKEELLKLINKERPKPYDGPERDLVNFPRRIRAEFSGKVRLGFLPDEWFTFFYKKTGVTGPYVFGTGLLTYLLSKEWYVIEEEFSTGVAIFLLSYMAMKKFGPTVKAYAYKLVDDEVDRNENKKKKYVDGLKQGIEDQKKNVWYAEGQKILMDAKRENVQMQLETEYRRRFMNVYEQTKKRLDYHLELYNTKRKLEQKHMVDWIVNSVVKSITPEQEKEALKKCIEDLNALSLKIQ